MTRPQSQDNDYTGSIIGCAIEVHRHLGPGLLESTYQHCLAHELQLQHIASKREWVIPVEYKGSHIECGYRVDLLVEDSIIVELKAVDRLKPIHTAQLITYLKLANLRTGLLINFNVRKLVDGIKRIRI